MAWQTPKTDWKAGDIPSAGDFNRIEENIRIIGRYDRAPAYAVTTGSANAYSVELDPAPNNYYDGMCVAVKIHVDNTGASTLNVNGLGARPIKKPNGQDVVAGNLKAGIIYTLRYNGQNFILQGSDSAGNAMPEHVLAGKTFSNDNGPDQVGTMPNQGKVIITPGTTNIIIPRGFHNGEGYVEGSPNLIPENIKEGVNVFGVIGTLIPLRSASGSKDITSTHTTISGLPFRPKFIVLTYNYWTGSNNNIFESILVNFRTFYIRGYTIRHYGTSAPSVVDTAPFTSLYDDGFEFRLPSSYADTIIANKCQATWYAWG